MAFRIARVPPISIPLLLALERCFVVISTVVESSAIELMQTPRMTKSIRGGVPIARTATKISTALLVLATMTMAHVQTDLSQSTALHNPARS
jgi:hypothetical protein